MFNSELKHGTKVQQKGTFSVIIPITAFLFTKVEIIRSYKAKNEIYIFLKTC